MDVLWGAQDDPTAKARDGGHGLGREGGQSPRPVGELAWHRRGAARAHLPGRPCRGADGAGTSVTQTAVLSHRWAQRSYRRVPTGSLAPTSHDPAQGSWGARLRDVEACPWIPDSETQGRRRCPHEGSVSVSAFPSAPGAPGGAGGHGDDPAGIQGGERGLQAANPFTHMRTEKLLPCVR